MTKVKKTLSIRPLIWEMISKEAKARGVSITRCIEDKFEFEDRAHELLGEEVKEEPVKKIKLKKKDSKKEKDPESGDSKNKSEKDPESGDGKRNFKKLKSILEYITNLEMEGKLPC